MSFFRILAHEKKPVIRFFHDFRLFCLRGHKLSLIRKKPCLHPANCCCYPLGCTLIKSSKWPGLSLNTLPQMRYKQRLNQSLDGFVVASQFMKNEVLGNGFDSKKIHLLPLYALKPSINPSIIVRERDLILFVGQLINGKGIDIAIKSLLYSSYPYRLFLAGDGKQKNKYESLVSKLKLQDRVTFLGRIPHKDLDVLYGKAACVLLPTRAPESFGLVGVEAMRFGTPVISTSLGGISDWLVEGLNGFKVSLDDPQSIGKKLDYLWEKPEIAKTMEKSSKLLYQEKYRPETHIKNLLSLFEQLNREKLHPQWGQFTYKGTKEVEIKINNLLTEVSEAIEVNIPQSFYKSILLIGGYGKGEGGVENNKGDLFLHNNFDFLVLTSSLTDKSLKLLRNEIDAVLLPISLKYGIGFDISLIPYVKLSFSQNLLMWYEMYHGHKLVIGDPLLISQLPFANINTVPSTEFWALLINRGTLMIINDWIIDQNKLSDPFYNKIIIKHIMKALIGFGDALLYFLGNYHWSYAEKLKRIIELPEISEKMRQLYQEAANFRFEPNYDNYKSKNIFAWLEELHAILADVFLKCESKRLHEPNLKWNSYLKVALKSSIINNFFSCKLLLKKMKALLNPPSVFLGYSWIEKMGFWLLSEQHRLGMIYPFVAFDIGSKNEKEQICRYLNAKNSSPSELRIAYLKQWSIYGDANFKRSLEEWNLSF